MRTIEIVVDVQGSVKIEALRFHGPDCEAATRFLEEALGSVQERRRKPEYQSNAKRRTATRVRT